MDMQLCRLSFQDAGHLRQPRGAGLVCTTPTIQRAHTRKLVSVLESARADILAFIAFVCVVKQGS